ncbi:hypothetical protein HNY73_007940 [Argiope bruennichi]|uniref:Uncharacterized protein n=1 Tax=Argiope bruennichi TaxID=94029 RepID=A0A8T0F4Q6_ARGBR|nr:hypothetical protein HNY73_007940 [Argiope bruennichi]
MRNITLFFTFLSFLGVLILQVESTSPRKCPPADQCYPCDKVNCRCGQLKDECDCCDVCLKSKDTRN